MIYFPSAHVQRLHQYGPSINAGQAEHIRLACLPGVSLRNLICFTRGESPCEDSYQCWSRSCCWSPQSCRLQPRTPTRTARVEGNVRSCRSSARQYKRRPGSHSARRPLHRQRCAWGVPCQEHQQRLHREYDPAAGCRLHRRRSGYPATKPAKGQKIDPNSPEVVKYVAYLDAQHDAALNSVGGGRKLYNYRYSFNGFAAELADCPGRRPGRGPHRAFVSQDELRTLDTSSTPAFLGLSTPGGLWDQLGGVERPAKTSSSASSTAASGPKAPASPTAPAATATAPRTAS